MAEGRAGSAETGPRTGRGALWLSVLVAGLVLWAGVAKALLFRNLEYTERDLYSFLDLSRSWLYTGHLLQDNLYGSHVGLHNFFVLPLLSPLTVPLGAYGFILALTLATLLGTLRVARTPVLDDPARLAVLAGLLGPVALFVFDNPGYGFHPELLYPPLVALLAVDLLEGRHRRALVPAGLMLLVKEDGAVLLAAVLLVHFSGRLWNVRRGRRDQRRRVLTAAALSLVAVTLVFVVGMGLLAVQSEEAGPFQENAAPRVLRAVKILDKTIAGETSSFQGERLRGGLAGYALVALALLLPLGRRLPRGVALFLLSAPVVVGVLVVSAAHYRFQLMFWPPRLALLLGLSVACLAHAASPADRPRRPGFVAMTLVAVSWAVQLVLVSQVGYSPRARLDPLGLVSGRGHPLSAVPEPEVRLLRCVAGRLPPGLPVSADDGQFPFFHRQSMVFEGREEYAWHPARLRVITASDTRADLRAGWCPGPRLGHLMVEGECDLMPRLEDCAAEGSAENPDTPS